MREVADAGQRLVRGTWPCPCRGRPCGPWQHARVDLAVYLQYRRRDLAVDGAGETPALAAELSPERPPVILQRAVRHSRHQHRFPEGRRGLLEVRRPWPGGP